MDQDIALIVLGSITAVGVVVWLIGLQFLLNSARVGMTRPPADDEIDFPAEAHDGWQTGSAEVEGDAPALASRAARILAVGSSAALGPVKILEKSDDHLRFERVKAGMGQPSAGQWFRRGELRFARLGSGRTRVEWAIEPVAVRGLLWAGGVIQVAGLIALVAGCWAIYTFVASSPNPSIRWQTVQMVQVVHLLWPPFLLGGVYRKGARATVTQFETLVHNLPYCEG